MRSPKFNFIPETQFNEKVKADTSWRVNLTKVSGGTYGLYFPREMVTILDLDGKYIRMFADVEKKAIGWVIEEGNTSLENLNGARKANKNQQSGALVLSVTRIISNLNYTLVASLKDLEVKTYSSPLVKNIIYYVILPDVIVETQPEKTEEANNVSA